MRKYLFSILIFLPLLAMANVQLTISDGLDDEAVRAKIERDLSALLTEINDAQNNGRALNLAAFRLTPSIQLSLSMLWENAPFVCTEETISERCITPGSGYPIRNITLMMKPRADRAFNEQEYQEAVVSFDTRGNMESFYLSLSNNLYQAVIKSNKQITDLRRRQLILDYVEQFRTSYDTKDINFLEQVFSDDALIITGRVISRKKDNIALPDKIVYKKQSKQEYLTNLRRTFANNAYIRVTFDDIKVLRHPVNPHFYGVTLHQGYTSSRYHDEGYLFLLWDFTNENQPQIHVRTWQPDQLNGSRIPDDEIFSLNDFDI